MIMIRLQRSMNLLSARQAAEIRCLEPEPDSAPSLYVPA